MKFNNRILTKPWLVAVISVVTSVAIYGLVVLFIDMPRPKVGLGLSIFIPLVVSPMVSLIIRRYVLQIEGQNCKLSELNANNKKLFLHFGPRFKNTLEHAQNGDGTYRA